jgi:hypothetical protein
VLDQIGALMDSRLQPVVAELRLGLDPALAHRRIADVEGKVPAGGIASPSRSNDADSTTCPVGTGSVDSTICSSRPTQL